MGDTACDGSTCGAASTSLDPERDFVEIYRLMGTLEFPWDMNQALSFALFRTYAVPSIGGLLARTGEFTGRAQQRYDDTVLILDAVLEHGLDSPEGRAAIRRMNQMHRMLRHQQRRHALRPRDVRRDADPLDRRLRLAADDRRRAGGRRELLPGARAAHGHPRHPGDLAGFARLLDAYERDHFAFDPGGRAVAESTLALLATFPPHDRLPAALVRRALDGTMDAPLLAAFRFPHPHPLLRALVRGGLKARGRVVRLLPPRRGALLRAGSCRRSAAIPAATTCDRLGTFPARLPRAARAQGQPRRGAHAGLTRHP